ncbi:MAG: hypothetical protein K8U57_31320 [Planctomycetes bacterium]|nr:hypothetical protein [Planctomycetota bacterium]
MSTATLTQASGGSDEKPHWNQNLPSVIRGCCAFVCLLAAIFAAVIVYTKVSANAELLSGNAVIDSVHYTDAVKAAITQKLEGAKGLFQASLVVLGILWGLVIAKKDDRALRITDRPEMIMFLSANVLFLVSGYCYSAYTDAMATVHAAGPVEYEDPKDLTIMDFRDSRIDNLYVWQRGVWVAAMIVTAIALFCSHVVKEHSEKAKSPCEPSPSPVPLSGSV